MCVAAKGNGKGGAFPSLNGSSKARSFPFCAFGIRGVVRTELKLERLDRWE